MSLTIDAGSRTLRAVIAFALILGTALTAFCGNAFAQVTTTPALYPTFDAGISDYVIRCDGDPVQVHVDAPANTIASVDGRRAQAGSFDARVSATTGQAFTVVTSGPAGADEAYHVRCLPTDFPTWSAERSGTPQSTFYVTTPSVSLTGGQSPYVSIFDTNGVPVWWVDSAPQPVDAKLLPNGNIAWAAFGPLQFEEFELDGTFVRRIGAVNTGNRFTEFHDLQLLPNGNYLVAALDRDQGDLTPCGGPSSGTIDDNLLQEVRPDGSVVWDWSTQDHIPLSEVPPQWHGNCRNGDPFHYNAIEPAGDNQVLVSYRHLNAIYKIDVTTGDIVWKLGGEPTAKSLTIVGDPNNGFSGQHDIRSLGDGTVTLYDNETGRLNPPRGVRYRIDEEAGTATLVEQATNGEITSSFCCGSARKLPGGNWVIGWGGRSVSTEQTAEGATVFRLAFDNGLFSYRTHPVTSGLSGAALRGGMDAQYPRPVTPEEEPDPVAPSPSDGAGSAKVGSDTTAPGFQVSAKTVQKILRQRGLLIEVGCPGEACTARARGTFSVSGAAKVFKLRTAKAKLSKGATAKLMLRLSKTARKALRRAVRKRETIQAKVTIIAADAAGNAATTQRTFKLKR